MALGFPTGPLKVAGLVDFKKPKAPTAPTPTAPVPPTSSAPGFNVLGGGFPLPTNPAPAPTGAGLSPSVVDLLGGGVVHAVNNTANTVAGLFSTPTGAKPAATTTPATVAAPPQYAPDGHVLSAAEIADKARAQGAGAAAGAASGAAGVTGQATESANANAMNTASTTAAAPASLTPDPNDPNVVKDHITGEYRYLTPAEITDRAAHQGMGAAAAAASAAAGAAGAKQEQTQAGAMANASAAAAKPAAAPTPPAPPAPPAAGSPQADLDTLRTAAVNAMNAKDDPVATREFNRAVLQIGMANQAQRDALKMQIAQDPALNGQPAGTAVLMAAAQAAGGKLDDVIAGLSIESAKRIHDLNQWGFDKLSAITDYRITQDENHRKEMLAAGDYDGYAQAFKSATGMDVDVKALKSLSPATQTAIENLSAAMNRNVAAGNMDAAKKNFAAIQALSPEAFGQLTFDDVITAPDAYKAHSDQQAGIWSTVRTQVASGQTADALAGLDALFPDKAKQTTDGAAAVASNDLTTINAALKAAGMSPVTDKSQLIGRESDVFKAMQIASITKEAGSTAIDKGVESLQAELAKLGYDPTKPEEATALRSYVLNLQLNGGLKIGANGDVELDPNSLIPPWDPKSPDAHLFSDWPVLAADGTTVIDPGGDPYGTNNPKPTPDSARGQYYAKLDTDWENYLAKTAPTGRLTRDQWFWATKAGSQAPDVNNIPGGIKPDAPDATDPVAFDTILQGVRTGKAITPDQETALIASGRIPKLLPQDLANTDLSTLVNTNEGLVQWDGHIVQFMPGKMTVVHVGSGIAPSDYLGMVSVKIGGQLYRMGSDGKIYPTDSNKSVDPWPGIISNSTKPDSSWSNGMVTIGGG